MSPAPTGAVVTDLPLSVDRRTVVARASPVHGVAVLSLPALGAGRGTGVRRGGPRGRPHAPARRSGLIDVVRGAGGGEDDV